MLDLGSLAHGDALSTEVSQKQARGLGWVVASLSPFTCLGQPRD